MCSNLNIGNCGVRNLLDICIHIIPSYIHIGRVFPTETIILCSTSHYTSKRRPSFWTLRTLVDAYKYHPPILYYIQLSGYIGNSHSPGLPKYIILVVVVVKQLETVQRHVRVALTLFTQDNPNN